MFGLFAHKPPLDEASTRWLFEVYAWALEQFGGDYFRDNTRLVLPSDDFFPGRSDSAEGMAALILNHVKRYAGMSHWPTRLDISPPLAFSTPPRIALSGPLRRAEEGEAHTGAELLPIHCDLDLVRNPQACIGQLAHNLAHYLGQFAQTQPPGGAENWPQLCEVLAIYLGFGVEIANTAFEVKVSGCGACQGPSNERPSYLSQYDLTYALAIFAQLKGLPRSEVSRSLKSALRPFFKQAYKDVGLRDQELSGLRALLQRPTPCLPALT